MVEGGLARCSQEWSNAAATGSSVCIFLHVFLLSPVLQYRLWDRIQDWVYLAVALAISLVTMTQRNEPALRGLRAAALAATSGVEARLSGVGRYVRALDENERLRQEAITLATEAARAREATAENDRLRALLGFRDSSAATLVPVRIVAKGLGGERNLLTIDGGTMRGVHDGMPLIDERGILGRVVLTSDHYARVMPYLNTNFRVVAKVRELGADGIVRWDIKRPGVLTMQEVGRTEQVRRGMHIVTGFGSDVFPAGFPIGTVDSVAAESGRNDLTILVRPAAPLANASFAFVLTVLPNSERTALEATPVE